MNSLPEPSPPRPIARLRHAPQPALAGRSPVPGEQWGSKAMTQTDGLALRRFQPKATARGRMPSTTARVARISAL